MKPCNGFDDVDVGSSALDIPAAAEDQEAEAKAWVKRHLDKTLSRVTKEDLALFAESRGEILDISMQKQELLTAAMQLTIGE